jgi:outer membrane protein TolC
MQERGTIGRLLTNQRCISKTILCGLSCLLLLPGSTFAQTMNASRPASTSNASPVLTFPPAQNPFAGSVPEGKASDTVLPLSFSDALQRGLRNNLGILLRSDSAIAARGQRWKELSELLPNISAAISENVQQVNLQALGLRGGGLPVIVGPFGFFDARAYLTQSVFDLHYIERERGAASNQNAAQYNYQDARDVVVLAVGNAYLEAIAGAARVDTAQAQVQTAQALYDKAADQQSAGVTPAIDTLRARVQLQTRQQQLIVAGNNFAKLKLTLARLIGLPSGQEFTLTDKAPYQPLATLGLEETLKRAYQQRSDYQAAMEQEHAAERFRAAASAEHLPSLGISGNYGDIGITPANSHGTFTVSGTLSIPVFQGGRVHADVLQAEASLRQQRQQLDNLRGQIDFEVRSAMLDLAAAAAQVEVARSSVDLAGQTLAQARDRFTAGVADNLEVIQAQEAVAAANENYISSLYAHNLAKVELARAVGMAEPAVKQYLSSK